MNKVAPIIKKITGADRHRWPVIVDIFHRGKKKNLDICSRCRMEKVEFR